MRIVDCGLWIAELENHPLTPSPRTRGEGWGEGPAPLVIFATKLTLNHSALTEYDWSSPKMDFQDES